MKYVNLGKTEISVSRLCVGGMSFGEPSPDFHLWTLSQEETTKMIGHAFELGGNFIDTANTYSHGTSEVFIGKAIKDLGIPRDKMILASKVYFNEGKLSRKAINREIDLTLSRLQTSYLDLYQIHRFDYDTPMEETMSALNDLIKSGKVRALGASAMYGYQFHNLQEIASKNGWTPFSAMQNHYNLIYREDERELVPICSQYSVSRNSYSPLAGGHLSHSDWNSSSLRSESDAMIRKKYDSDKENDLQIIKRVEELAMRHQVSMSQISLAWQFKKGVASPIVGATDIRHFDDAVASVDLELTDEEEHYLDELYLPHKIVGAL
ncbi:MAG: aldo/keto reductase [Bacilli bacterium]